MKLNVGNISSLLIKLLAIVLFLTVLLLAGLMGWAAWLGQSQVVVPLGSGSESAGLFLRPAWIPANVAIANYDVKPSYMRSQIKVTSDQILELEEVPDKWEFVQAIPTKPHYTYIIQTADIPTGKKIYDVKLQDQNQNPIYFQARFDSQPARPQATYWPGTEFYADPDDLLTLANKKYRLPMFYEPKDLVKLDDYDIRNYNTGRVRKILIEDLKKMTDAIKAARIDYKITSSYRSFTNQVSAYNYWLDITDNDVARTDSFSARPGHSEHQLGTTLDFVSIESEDTFYQFEKTSLSKWLVANAHKYGFVLSYPQGKQHITGYTFEPWHYRYIGPENAAAYRESGLTLTEWLYQQHGVEEEGATSAGAN